MFSCQKDPLVEGIAGLEFSTDTVAFDTVFTTMGTITRQVKVYNHSNNPVEIETITLREGRDSRFRLNVDGDTSMVQHDVTILPNDSIFIFVRANINPNDATSPFVVEDAILLQDGNTQKQIVLTAWGRNAIYHNPDHVLRNADGSYPLDAFGNPYRYSVIDCDNWRHDLPHVIIGYAVVDSRNTLTLKDGDELYFHNDAVLWVYDSATLKVQGTAETPVLFTSIRHDSHYNKLPGQWGYIWLSTGSKDNEISNAIIENGYVGILADTNVNNNPTLKIENTIIRNQSMAGIMGQTAWIEGSNVLVHTCGTATLALQYGGKYAFANSTFADYWRYSTRTNPSVVLNNHYSYQGSEYLYDAMQISFSDCIIYGSHSEGEMLIDLDDRVSHTLTISHSIVKGGEWDEDPLFADTENDDYTLQENSPAQGIGWQQNSDL
ncbi:MAG: hypothetical protein KBT45_01140 [Bacteroidales bacterium]|nr:hypothetical protein [Candidatus Colimorpha pelethequi]